MMLLPSDLLAYVTARPPAPTCMCACEFQDAHTQSSKLKLQNHKLQYPQDGGTRGGGLSRSAQM